MRINFVEDLFGKFRIILDKVAVKLQNLSRRTTLKGLPEISFIDLDSKAKQMLQLSIKLNLEKKFGTKFYSNR